MESGSTTMPTLSEAMEALQKFVRINAEWPPPPGSDRAEIHRPIEVALECMSWAEQARRSGRRLGVLTVEEAARWLGISRGAAYRAVAAGELPTLRLGRRVYVPVAQLEEIVGPSEERAG